MKYPSDLLIYLDSRCNLSCFFCLYQGDSRRPTTRFSLNNLAKLEKAIQHAEVISFSAWGEPLYSPHFYEAVQFCCGLNHKRHLIAFVTNGALLSPSVADLLRGHMAAVDISINAATAATYNRDMRGGDFDQTMAAIQSFMATTDSPERVGLHFVAHALNHTEIPALIQVSHSLKIRRVRVDQLMVANPEQRPYSLLGVRPEYDKSVSQAKKVAQKLGVEFKARTFSHDNGQRCSAPTTEAHIWADGRVAPCCYNGSVFMGNAYETSFEAVWAGKEYERLRREQMPQCQSCPWTLPLEDRRAHVYPMLWEKGIEA